MSAPKKTPAKRQQSPRKKAASPAPNGTSEVPAVQRRPFTHLQVYSFVPNLIGYARAILTGVAIYLLLQANRKHTDEWKLGLTAYTLSFILDFFDGFFARKLQQSSDFGAVLDMVTDRVSTMLLLVVLTTFYPERFEWFAFLAALDYSSHWVQMYASKGHHKTTNQDKNIIVRAFYGIYPFFGFCCVGTELFYIAMAAQHFVKNNEILNFLIVPFAVACICKNVVNVAQLMSGFEAVAKRDAAATLAK